MIAPQADVRRPLRWPVILLALVILLGIAVTTGITENPDRALMKAIAFRVGTTPDSFIEAAQWITWTGDAAQRTVLAFALAGMLVWRRLHRSALVLIVAVPLAGVSSSLLKEVFARERPEIVPHLDLVTSLSYPSGHAVNAMSVLLLGALLLARSKRGVWVALALSGAAIIGLSRLVLGVHYPTDIVGGWMLGAAAALIAWRIALVWETANAPKTPELSEESPEQ
jgi:undecaprenyl-diphosphatase